MSKAELKREGGDPVVRLFSACEQFALVARR